MTQGNLEYAGIPIPTVEEQVYVEFACGVGRHSDDTMIKQAFQELRRKRPQVDEVMYSSSTIACERFDNEPAHLQEQIARGVRSGFRFMSGLITYVSYIRSDAVDVRDFVEEYDEKLPLQTQDEQVHVENTLRGNILVESREGLIEQPHDIVKQEAEDYINEALIVETVLDREEAKIAEMFRPTEVKDFTDYASEPQSFYTMGFQKGVFDAICMYV